MGTIHAILRALSKVRSWFSGKVLRDGEFAYETDDKGLKIGDGVTPYENLPYLLPPKNGVDDKFLKCVDGNVEWYDVPEQTQTDWEQDDNTQSDYLKNMPDVFRNLPDIPSGNIIPDGTVIERVVQDYDGNWYDGVVIGNQIWTKSNLRVKHDKNGNSIDYRFNPGFDESIYGLLYKPETVLGEPIRYESFDFVDDYRSVIVQGISPNGWHIPNFNDWVNINTSLMQTYDTFSTARLIASDFGWDTNFQYVPCEDNLGCNQENNNGSNFTLFPVGYYTTGHVDQGRYAKLISAIPSNVIGYNYTTLNLFIGNALNVLGYSANADNEYCSVRCVCDISASDWFAANRSRLYLKVTSTGMVWSQISAVAESGSYNDLSNQPTIPSSLNDLSDISITSASSGQALVYDGTDWVNQTINIDLAESITYSNLVSLISANSGAGNLVPGKLYRITDYVTTTFQTDTQSANHSFDLVVMATSPNTLDCQAKAVLNANDTYFSASGNTCDLSKWQVWYDINNNTTKYAWADTTNGKGVIYRMIDENSNECSYDFKNIQFKRKIYNGNYNPTSGTDTWCYTFSKNSSGTMIDSTLVSSNKVYSNVIKGYYSSDKLTLNNNVFIGSNCSLNILNINCSSNTMGSSFAQNSLGISCSSNVFGTLCKFNSLGNNSSSNTFGNMCYYNIFGNYIVSNILGNNCSSNVFWNNCSHNTLSNNCGNNTLGNSCNYIVFGDSNGSNGTHVRNVVVENGCEYIRLYNTGTASTSNYLQNIYIAQGVSGNSTTYFEISTIARNLSYRTTVAKDSIGTTRIYNEDDKPTVSGLGDVNITAASLANGQMLQYNSTSQKWENVDIPSDAFICTLTSTTVDDTTTYSCDKTIAEIKAADNAGKVVLMKTDIFTLPLTIAESSVASFSAFFVSGLGVGIGTAYGTNDGVNDSWTFGLTGMSNVAFSGDYSDLSNLPTLGTAAALDVPASGNASSTQVVKGDDTRLTDARTPASHIHGNITNDGKVGSASGKILTTGTDGAVQASDSITKSMISDFPSLATVATSGSYNDLTNKPTIPSAGIPSGGNAGQVLKKQSATNYDVNWANASETLPSAYCTTSGSIPGKKANCSLYVAQDNQYLQVLIGSDNTYQGALTLNINSSGAKPIYINGTASSSSNYKLRNGTYFVFYDGTNYYFRTDGKLPMKSADFSGSYTELADKPTIPDVTTKADKVSNATNGNFAALDSNGNLTDSGHNDSNYAPLSHTHGAITSEGKIQSEAIAPEDGQSLVVIKVSNSTVQKSTITFDTSNTSAFLRKDGTWATPSSGGGLTNYDFTHTANQSVSGSVTVTYAANTRGSKMVSASADLSVTFAVNNSSDNYLWIKNTGSSDIDILISSVTYNNSSVSNVYMPADGIAVPAGKVCEIGIVCNADGAFITSRSDLSL